MSHFPQNEYIQMLIDVSYGLMSIHQKKMMHRDIKPENVIYSKGIFKITDFGTSTQKEISNSISGTCLYWAPQIIEDLESSSENTEFTQALDIWSFGLLAFEAYFLIHPFFYDKQNHMTQQQMMRQLKKNIDAITPNFTFPKLISHLVKLGHHDKARFIESKLKQTDEALQESFKGFFCRTPERRQSIQILLGIFQSIQSYQFQKVEIKSSKVVEKKQLPPDIDFFVESLNLFYKLNHMYTYPKDQILEFHLELGLRFLTISSYNGKDFVHYHRDKQIASHEKISASHYDKIKESLTEYYFYLTESKELEFQSFAEQLPKLKLYVCLCSCWHIIRQNLKKFLKRVEQITQLQNGDSVQEFRQIIPALTEKQLSLLENFIIGEYFR